MTLSTEDAKRLEEILEAAACGDLSPSEQMELEEMSRRQGEELSNPNRSACPCLQPESLGHMQGCVTGERDEARAEVDGLRDRVNYHVAEWEEQAEETKKSEAELARARAELEAQTALAKTFWGELQESRARVTLLSRQLSTIRAELENERKVNANLFQQVADAQDNATASNAEARAETRREVTEQCVKAIEAASTHAPCGWAHVQAIRALQAPPSEPKLKREKRDAIGQLIYGAQAPTSGPGTKREVCVHGYSMREPADSDEHWEMHGGPSQTCTPRATPPEEADSDKAGE